MTTDTSDQQRRREEAFRRLTEDGAASETLERRPVVVRLSEVKSEPVRWLWLRWLAYGLLTILGGYGGDGKSTLLMYLVAVLSRGGVLPDGSRAPVANTLILSAEDDPRYAIAPRLEAHHADMDRVILMKGVEGENGRTDWTDLRKHADQLREVIQAENIGLLIIEPLSSYMPKSDRNSEGDLRDALMPLQSLMEETRVAVIGVMHVGKAEGNRRASQRLLGPTAFTALARSVWMVHDLPDEYQSEYDPDNPTVGKRKALGVVKSNYAVPPAALAFSRPLDGPVAWHGTSPVGIEECFAEDVKKAAPRITEAVEWLADFLKGGSKFANEVYTAAEQADISEGTLRIAKRKLNVETYKDTGPGGRWLWKLPNGPTPDDGGTDSEETSPNGHVAFDPLDIWEKTA